LRGLSYFKVGRLRQALLAFRRALQLDPNNALARDGLWALHRSLNLETVGRDRELVALLDFDMCLDRAGSLLLNPGPTPAMQQEAQQLLDLVLSQRPALEPQVLYWRAVAFTHARDLDQAAACLERILATDGMLAGNRERRSILMQAWQLAILLHPELNRRVGSVQLGLPGRRMEAIAAVERRLQEVPQDSEAWTLKRLLYADLTEADYNASCPNGRPAANFDHDYSQQLGLALIEDSSRWQRGAEFLRIAAHGLPALGPSIFTQIARAQQQAGHADEALRCYEMAKQAGKAVGPKSLAESERQAYFGAVKLLAETASSRCDLEAAIENYHLYTEYERSGLETLKVLTDLYERKGDSLGALRVNEQALVYNGKDKELLERKERYYWSVQPDDLKARLDSYGKSSDVDYCIRKATSLQNFQKADLESIDWAEHLAALAQVVRPEGIVPKVLRGRAVLRRGDRDGAVALFEEVYTNKPEKFPSRDDEDAWFTSCQQLGRLYIELGQPEKAVPCLNDFRKSPKSGADTMYNLGQAHEALGDYPRAIKCYEHVLAYEGHPRFYDARAAVSRLQTYGRTEN
jgi:tetratricopeptide (TPR) repeat protein